MLILKYTIIAILILQVFNSQRFKRSEQVFSVQAVVGHVKTTINLGGGRILGRGGGGREKAANS